MALIVSSFLAFVAAASAQLFQSPSPRLAMMTSQSMWGAPIPRSYRTCIGQTAAGDELRVTFSGQNQATSRNWWDNSNGLKVEADITSTSIAGIFQLIATENGRVDGACESGNLGELISSQTSPLMSGWWNQGALASGLSSGLIGNQFNLSPGKTVSITDNINAELTMDRISGGGMAVCPVNQLVGNRCMDIITLCCSIVKDSRPANRQVQLGMQGGVMGGMNGQMMGGMNGPMMGGMNSQMMGGMNGQMMGGMNGQMMAPVRNGRPQGMNPGLNAGMGIPNGQGMQAAAFQG